jgi:hypothetical protein
MKLEDALARAKSWEDAPMLRPEPNVAKDVAVTLARHILQLEAAARLVLREALDDVPVHPCDVEDDAVRAKGLPEPMANLYAAVTTPSEQPPSF